MSNIPMFDMQHNLKEEFQPIQNYSTQNHRFNITNNNVDPEDKTSNSKKRKNILTKYEKNEIQDKIQKFNNWQKETIELNKYLTTFMNQKPDVNQKPNVNQIYWFWERNGNVQKSMIIRYLVSTYTNHIKFLHNDDWKHWIHCLDKEWEKTKKCYQLIVIDLQEFDQYKVNYEAIQQIKNDCLLVPIPHVIVLANFPPQIKYLCADRWIIHEYS